MKNEKKPERKSVYVCVAIVHGVHKNRINSWKCEIHSVVSVWFSPVCIIMNRSTQVLHTRAFYSLLFEMALQVVSKMYAEASGSFFFFLRK